MTGAPPEALESPSGDSGRSSEQKKPGAVPSPTYPVLFDGLAHFWEYCLVLTFFDDVLLTVPPGPDT